MLSAAPEPPMAQQSEASPRPAPAKATADNTARVLPFRRAVPAPPQPLEELAEPLHLFPRILDVPEVAPPPPALGGILIEPEIEEVNQRRPGIEVPLYTATV